MAPKFHLLILCFTLLHLRHTATAADVLYPVYTYCPNPPTYDRGPVPPAFQLSLQNLLSGLSSAAKNAIFASTASNFSSATADSPTSYSLFGIGIFLCRGDVNSDTCASCVNSAAAELYSSCARSSQAMIWYSACMIKYSDTSFVGSEDDTLGNAFRRVQTVGGNLTAFNSVLGSVASTVENQAAAGHGEKFAMGEGKVNDSLTVYVLGQCTPDLSPTDCRHCLGECIKILRDPYCENRVGGLVLYGSCNLRYDTYPFYYNSSSGSADHPYEPLDSQYYDVESYLKDGILRTEKDILYQQLLIDCGVLVTTILLFGVFLLGSLRRRVYGSSTSSCILVFHSLIAILIPFLLGLMRSASHPHKSFIIWACFLLFAYGGFDTMSARDLSDNDNSTSYFLRTFSVLSGIVYVALEANKNIIDTTGNVVNLVLYIILVCLSAWNVIDTMGAFRAASKSNGLPEASKQTEYHMCHVFTNNNAKKEGATTGDDAVSMRGYSYLVLGTPSNDVTTTNVWECFDKLFKSPTPIDDGESNCKKADNNKAAGERLKEICLSRALFNTLLMRCAGYTLPDNSRKKSMKFVKDGLLPTGSDPQEIEKRIFTIIEWELEFLFDFFYTKFYYHSTKRAAFKFRRLVIFAIFVWFAIYEFQPEIGPSQGRSIILYHGHNVKVGIAMKTIIRAEVAIARTVIILITIMEAVQLCMLIFSNWTIAKLICLYASKSNTVNTFFIKVTILFFSFAKLPARLDKWRLSSCMFNPWRRKLGQYSLLENYDKVPMLHRLLLCYAPRVAQKESNAVTLSLEVKRAVVSLLADHGFTMSCGKTSLCRNGLADQLSIFCIIETEGDAFVILVWHIATSVYEHHYSTQPFKQEGTKESFAVATQLSKYCAYLAIFAPEFLSEAPYKTQTTVLDTIECVREKLKGSKQGQWEWSDLGTQDIAGLCSKLVSAEHEWSNLGTQDKTIFGIAVIVNHLRSLDDFDRGWKVLAEFWVELIIYLAPTENAIAHAEHLAKGGEFITLLWALLTNAGITSRSHFKTTSSE